MDRNQNVSSFGASAVVGAHENPRTAHCFRISLASIGLVSSDQVEMRAGSQIASIEQRSSTGGAGADHIGLTRERGRIGGDDCAIALTGHFGCEFRGGLRFSAADENRFEGANEKHRGEMGTRDSARAEDSERGRVFASETLCGDGGRGRGAQRREVICGYGEDGFAGGWIEEKISGVNSLFTDAEVIADCDQLHAESGSGGIEARHDEKCAAGDLQMLARWDHNAREAIAKSVFNAGDHVWGLEETADISFSQI